MRYKTSIDEVIIQELYKKQYGFNELFEILKKNSLTSSRTTLSKHLKKMEKHSVIDKKQEIGKGAEIKLSIETREEIKLGIFRGVNFSKKVRLKLSEEEKIRNAIHLILSVASRGSSVFKEVLSPRPGDIAIPISEDTSKEVRSYSLERYEGFSPSDLINKLWMGGNAGTFRDPEILPSDIRSVLKTLEDTSIIRQRSIGRETRYTMVDNHLSDFIIDCESLFSSVLSRLKLTWFYRMPESSEVEWVSTFFGRKELIKIFENAHNTRTEINRKTRKVKLIEKKEIKRQIRLFDKMIIKQLNRVNTNKTKIPQYAVFSKIFTETIYPKHLKQLQMNDIV